MTATSNVIDQEKMAVILQEVVGSQHGDRFYPTFSGVLRSLNYYPIGDEKAEEGIAQLALGLGKYIVDGGQTLRVSPYHPNQVLQTSELDFALRQTQTRFYALDCSDVSQEFKVDDGFNILNLKVKEADADGTLYGIASTYDPYDQIIRDGIYDGGRKVITFSGVLQQNVMPLPEILQEAMHCGADAMKRPVEIEFACDLRGQKAEFYLLQIRPIVDTMQSVDEDLRAVDDSQCLLRSDNTLGHGIIDDVCDVVYVKTDQDYNAANNPEIAVQIERLNQQFLASGGSYALVGPGRWGSSDPWLGIPVKWPHISCARIIAEVALPNYRIDPSQGTHFFQNLTSLGVGYFTIDASNAAKPAEGSGESTSHASFFRKELLDGMPAVSETEYIRHVRLPKPLRILMDGKKQLGVVILDTTPA